MRTNITTRLSAAAFASAALMAGCGGEDAADCETSGHACTWAGLPGLFGFNGDGLHRLETEFYWTMDIMFASNGTPWLIDWNNHIVRRVKSDDTIETIVGGIDPIFPGDGTGDASEKSADGATGQQVLLNHPTDLGELPDGTILLMAWHNHKLRTIDPATGKVKIVAGGGAGFAGDGAAMGGALFRQPSALQRDDDGNIYILDQQNFRIRKIDPAGMITTFAGNGMQGYDGDGGPALMAKLNFEAGSNPEPSGGMEFSGGKLYFSDTLSHRVRAIDVATGMIETIAGTGEAGFSEGVAKESKLAKPHDLELGPDGELYVADTDNSRIRAINLTTGMIRTVAGTGELGLDTKEGIPATEMKLLRPFGIGFDKDGNLYICDTINSRIVKVAK